MSATKPPKSSPRTTGRPKPRESPSGASSSNGHKNGKPNTSARTRPPSESKAIPSGRSSSNGTQQTTPRTKSNVASSAASDFNLAHSLREHLDEHPDTHDVTDLIDGYVLSLSPDEIPVALRAALRKYLPDMLGASRRRTWNSDGGGATAGSAKWDAVREASQDGSLDRYRQILAARIVKDNETKAFGAFTVQDIDWLIDYRAKQREGLEREIDRLERVRKAMRSAHVKTVDGLSPERLMKEWDA